MDGDSAAPGGTDTDQRIYYDPSVVDVDAGAAAALPAPLRDLLKRLDLDEKGYVDVATLNKFKAVPRQSEVSNGPSTLTKSRVTARVTPSVLFAFDYDGDGFVDTNDISAAHRKMTNIKEENSLSRRLIFALVACLLVLTTAMFAVSFAAAQLAKDTHVGEDTIVRTDSGDVALIGSADIRVFNGSLVDRSALDCRSGEGCRRLTESSAQPLVTATAQHHKTLTSRIADEVFQNLDRVTVHLAETDGINTAVTLRVHGHMRTRKDGSHCGTIVRLDTLEGTIILDDADIHLDARLVEHFFSSGLQLGELSSYGRRLQMSSTYIYGIFSYFDELEVRCATDTSPAPHSPKMPYRITTLEKRPCREDRCESQIFPGLKRPGYDAASDSIVTLTNALVADDYTITFETWPNYPEHTLLTVVDHVAQTTHYYQTHVEESIAKCWNSSYNPDAPTNVSDWHIVYLGETSRPEAVIEHLGDSYVIPASINRVFKMRSNHDSMEEGFIYEEDSMSHMPKRMFSEMARGSDLDVEDLITLEFKEMDQSDADALHDVTLASVQCLDSEEEATLIAYGTAPRMEDPFDESISAVSFFVDEMQTNNESVAAQDTYWAYAVEHLNETVIEAYREKQENASETDDEGRRLAEESKCDGDLTIKLGSSKCISLTIDRSAGLCLDVSTKNSGPGPWAIDGSILVGHCWEMPVPSVSGVVTVSYTIARDLKAFKFSASISGSIYGYALEHTYKYYTTGTSCPRGGRRLQEDQGNALPGDMPEDLEEGDETMALDSPAPADLAQDAMELEAANSSTALAEFAEDDSDLEATERRLWGRRRRRSRRRRRNIPCKSWGFSLGGAIALSGNGKILGIGLTVSGMLMFELGPWPDPPLNRVFSVYIKVKGCVTVGWARVCKSHLWRIK